MAREKVNHPQKVAGNNRIIFSWSLYDFANSAFTTLVVTFIYATYFVESIAQNKIEGASHWFWAVSISFILVALISPIMGAIADKSNLRKPFLIMTTLICVIATAMLYIPLPGEIIKALGLFIIANFAFEMGMVFYNAYLPEITSKSKIGRISGYGWSLGYVGGLLCLVLAFIGFVDTEAPWFGFSKIDGENIRATNLLVAGWFLIFSIPAFVWLKSSKVKGKINLVKSVKQSLLQLAITFKEIKKYQNIFYLLLARIFYNDGLVTIFTAGGVYAVGVFGFETKEVLVFGIVLNIAAGIGAFGFGFLDDKIGGKATIQISNIGLIAAVVIAVFAPDRTFFWAAGILVGLLSGPNQAASRSLLGRYIPKHMENEFYGFFAFSGKATAFMGPLLFGILTELYESQRAGMAVLVLFFAVGIILLSKVRENNSFSTY